MIGQDTENKIKCWDCEGKGYVFLPFCRIPPATMRCDRCEGDGICPEIMLEWQKEGQQYKQKRIELRLTLKDSARLLDLNINTVSRAERGIINPSVLNETRL